MEESNPAQEKIQSDIKGLQEALAKITEMLQVLTTNQNRAQEALVSQSGGIPMQPQHTQNLNTSWPEFGLPPNFSPSFMNEIGIGTSNQQSLKIPMVNEQQPIVHTIPQNHFEDNLSMHNEFGSHEQTDKAEETNEKYQVLEKRLKAIEGQNLFGLDAVDMCLVAGVTLPAKFKVPDFEKYKGLSCPKGHLVMYCRKMATYIHNNKLMIHCFQDSLSGASLKWYMNLEKAKIQSWRDLAEAFLAQYRYNMDMAPDRRQLKNMIKKDRESFKEYAHCWRELASQVEPPLLEKELVDTFTDTLHSPFYEKMIGSSSTGFSDLVTIGERIEHGLKSGKITSHSEASNAPRRFNNTFQKKKEGEANTVISNDRRPYQNATPANHQPQNRQREYRRIDPIPIPYSQLWTSMVQKELITPRPTRPMVAPFPPNYDPNVTCAFHSGVPGHSIENCRILKEKVQDMIDSKILSFKDTSPNVNTNPLPTHSG